MRLPIKRIDTGLPLPSYAHAGDAGLDLHSAIDCEIAPGGRVLVPTGIAVAIPEGFAGFVLPKSGRAWKEGLSFANTPGLIDAHYRGEIKVIAINLDPTATIKISRAEKIAQLVVERIEHVELDEVDSLDGTRRGEGGFGSTGL